jgi:chromosomal replication initiation ATPase DnaA
MVQRIKRDGIEARARQVVMQVAGALGLTADGILRSAAHREATGRRIVIYVLHSSCGLSLGQIAIALRLDRSTVASACRAIEDRRDNLKFDTWMTALECSASAAPPPADPQRLVPADEVAAR